MIFDLVAFQEKQVTDRPIGGLSLFPGLFILNPLDVRYPCLAGKSNDGCSLHYACRFSSRATPFLDRFGFLFVQWSQV